MDRIRYERPGNAVEQLGVPQGDSVDEAGAAERQEFTELLQTLGSSIFAGRFAEQDAFGPGKRLQVRPDRRGNAQPLNQFVSDIRGG